MSDLGTIGIVVEVKGRDALRQIQSDMDAVDRSTKTAAQSFAAFERAGLKSANTFKYMAQETKDWLRDQQRILSIKDQSEKMAQKQAQAEAKITAEIVKQRQASEQAAAASARAYQSQIGGNLGLGAQGISAGASASAMEAEIERLRQKYDQVYAASRLYESSLKELNRAHMLGVTSTKQHEAAVESLNLEYQNFQNGTATTLNRFTSSLQGSTAGMNNVGVLMQQLGYQTGDFIVQVQSGTNAFVAFGQQATQLAGFLPMLGAELGIARVSVMGLSVSMAGLTLGMSVLIPLVTMLGALWMRTSEDTVQSADRQKQAIDSVIESTRNLRLEREMGISGASSSAEQEVINTTNSLLAERAALQERINSLNEIGGRATGLSQQKQAQQELLQIELDKNQLALDNLANENNIAIAARRRANEQKEAYRATKKDATDLYNTLMNAAKVNLASVFAEANPFAATLLAKMNGILGAMSAAASLQVTGSASVGLPPPPVVLGYSGGVGTGNFNFGSSGGVGSGGGSSGNAGLETLINSLQTEREVIDQWYAESQASLQSASDAELAIIGGRHEAELRLEEEHQKRLAGIKEAGNKSMLETTLSGAGEILSALGAFNDKALRISKVFAAAEALVSTYQGAAAELKKGVLGFGTAAAVIAKGIGFVAAIKGVSSSGTTSGTSSGGGRGSATVPTTTAQATPQTVYIDSISPENLYTGQTLINLFDAFYSENDKRGKVFVVGK